jgi:hypothetical protein
VSQTRFASYNTRQRSLCIGDPGRYLELGRQPLPHKSVCNLGSGEETPRFNVKTSRQTLFVSPPCAFSHGRKCKLYGIMPDRLKPY